MHWCVQILVAISAFLKDIYRVQTHNNEHNRGIENEIDTKMQTLKTCDDLKFKLSPFAFHVSMVSLKFFINWFLWYFRIALFTMPFHWSLDRNTEAVMFWLIYLLRSYFSRTEQIPGMKPNCLLASKFLNMNWWIEETSIFPTEQFGEHCAEKKFLLSISTGTENQPSFAVTSVQT